MEERVEVEDRMKDGLECECSAASCSDYSLVGRMYRSGHLTLYHPKVYFPIEHSVARCSTSQNRKYSDPRTRGSGLGRCQTGSCAGRRWGR